MSATPEEPSRGRGEGFRGLRVRQSQNPDAQMPLLEHIRELRGRLVKAILGVLAGVVVGVVFYHWIYHVVIGPYCSLVIDGKRACKNGHGPAYLGVFDGFMTEVKICVVVGAALSSPIWFYQLWAFIAPGLYRRERRWTYLFVGTAVPLWVLGGYFSYLAMNRALGYLVRFIPPGSQIVITIDSYVGYVMMMLLIFGIAFEIPLIMIILNLAGILSHSFFRKHRRMIIFAVFAFAAAFTPSPDPLSMLLLAMPVLVLVEASEVFIWVNDSRRARRATQLNAEAASDPVPEQVHQP